MATTIPLSGDLHDPDADIWAAIGGLLKNAFIRALAPGREHSVKARL